MTGPEHYRAAERLLASATIDIGAGQAEGNRIEHDTQVARAQVHATLALTAATLDAEDIRNGSIRDDTSVEWNEALS